MKSFRFINKTFVLIAIDVVKKFTSLILPLIFFRESLQVPPFFDSRTPLPKLLPPFIIALHQPQLLSFNLLIRLLLRK